MLFFRFVRVVTTWQGNVLFFHKTGQLGNLFQQCPEEKNSSLNKNQVSIQLNPAGQVATSPRLILDPPRKACSRSARSSLFQPGVVLYSPQPCLNPVP